jgi:hypothetical protein
MHVGLVEHMAAVSKSFDANFLWMLLLILPRLELSESRGFMTSTLAR